MFDRCLQVHAMLEEVGRAARAADEEESYTSRCMRAAFTPQCVAKVRSYSLAQVVQHLQRLTMKLALLLQMDDEASGRNSSGSAANGSADGSSMQDDEEDAPPRLSYSIDGVVDEYTELAMLLHVASDKVNLQLGERECLSSLQEMRQTAAVVLQLAAGLQQVAAYMCQAAGSYHSANRGFVLRLVPDELLCGVPIRRSVSLAYPVYIDVCTAAHLLLLLLCWDMWVHSPSYMA
jgi:hypothetical protein